MPVVGGGIDIGFNWVTSSLVIKILAVEDSDVIVAEGGKVVAVYEYIRVVAPFYLDGTSEAEQAGQPGGRAGIVYDGFKGIVMNNVGNFSAVSEGNAKGFVAGGVGNAADHQRIVVYFYALSANAIYGIIIGLQEFKCVARNLAHGVSVQRNAFVYAREGIVEDIDAT